MSEENAPIVDHGWSTAPGPRPDNQDRAASSPRWGVVSDGVGGEAGGGQAADYTIAAVVAALTVEGRPVEAALDEAVGRANAAVRAGRAGDPAVARMAATLTVAAASSVEPGGSTWIVKHVGDSSAFVVTAGDVRQVTRDHSLAMELVEAGVLDAGAAPHHPSWHVIVRSIGGDDAVAADTMKVALAPGEAIVLASDGLTDAVTEAEVHREVRAAPSAAIAADRLVEAALAAGTRDNVTVVVLRHVDPSSVAGSAVR